MYISCCSSSSTETCSFFVADLFLSLTLSFLFLSCSPSVSFIKHHPSSSFFPEEIKPPSITTLRCLLFLKIAVENFTQLALHSSSTSACLVRGSESRALYPSIPRPSKVFSHFQETNAKSSLFVFVFCQSNGSYEANRQEIHRRQGPKEATSHKSRSKISPATGGVKKPHSILGIRNTYCVKFGDEASQILGNQRKRRSRLIVLGNNFESLVEEVNC